MAASPGGGPQWNPQSQRWEWAEEPPTPPRQQRFGRPGRLSPAAGAGREWKVPLLVAVGAAVLGGSAVAGWFVLSGPDAKDPEAPPSASGTRDPASDANASPSTSPSARPSYGSSPDVSPGPGTSASPSTEQGHTVVHDEDGFSVAVPAGWERSRSENGNGSFYRRPGDRSALLQIFRVTEPADVGACALLGISSTYLSSNEGYREVSLGPSAGTSCELVYEYDSAESNGRRRGIERITAAADGSRWALLSAGPAADETAVRAHLTAALDSFRPD
ncbi:hypothetical protein ACF059_27215 [Streptomyces sp. NPDC016562]|uniref:hypothetical protein n=1 Tax=Streptomyces sp. NPDC016562 TaxID=3364966 RepID=UPI0036FDD733